MLAFLTLTNFHLDKNWATNEALSIAKMRKNLTVSIGCMREVQL